MADDTVARACRDIGDRYAFFASWTGADAANIRRCAQAPVHRCPAGNSGARRRRRRRLLATNMGFDRLYEGSGPKTDDPAAELPTIRQVNAEAAVMLETGPGCLRQRGRAPHRQI